MLNNVLMPRDAALSFAHKADERAIEQAERRLVWALLALLLVAVASIGAVIAVMRQVIRPLVRLTAVTLRLADRELGIEIPGEDRKDEIGAMAKALQIFKDALIAKEAADATAARDADAQIERGRRVDAITRDFEAMIGEIVEDRVLGGGRAAGFRRHADHDRRSLETARHHGGRSVGGSLRQCPVGGLRHGRAHHVGDRDQPKGPGIGAHGP
jgi:HAMP domain-containing protein